MKTKQNKFEKFNKKTTLNKELLANVKGGIRLSDSGWLATVSGDCNSSGTSCWKLLKELF